MIDHALRILTAAAQDPTYGVNVHLAAAAGAGWLAPGQAAPPLVAAIGCDVDTNGVAWGDFPPGDPSLALTRTADAMLQGYLMTTTGNRDASNVAVFWRYQHDHPDTAQAVADWYVTARALMMTVRRLMQDVPSTRTLGGANLYACEQFNVLGPYTTPADVRTTGTLILLVDVRDLLA